MRRPPMTELSPSPRWRTGASGCPKAATRRRSPSGAPGGHGSPGPPRLPGIAALRALVPHVRRRALSLRDSRNRLGRHIRWESALGMDGHEHWTAYVSIDSAVTTEDGLKGPKNSRRYRSVPIPSVFADPLYAIRATGPFCQSIRYTKDGGKPAGHRLTPDRIPSKWKSYFAEGGCLHGLPFVWLNRMRATYATLMQGAGIDSTLINALQGRSQNSEVLYSGYLNPRQDAFAQAAKRLQDGLETG